MSDRLAPWIPPDLSLPISGWRMTKGRLRALGHLSADGLYKGSLNYINAEGDVTWVQAGNLMNDVVFGKMARSLAAKLEDDPCDPREKRTRAEEALDQCKNQLTQQLTNASVPTNDDTPHYDYDDSPIYEATAGGMWWDRETREGTVKTRLTNFSAEIIGHIKQDDGAEITRLFEMEAKLKGLPYKYAVNSSDFAGLSWVYDQLGPEAIVYPGFAVKDHTRAAIQVLSGDIPERRVYTYTGWCKVDRKWIYLHGGGAIGESGDVADIEVSLPPPLQNYWLPEASPGKALQEAIRASLAILDVAGDSVTVPILGGVYRSILGTCDFSIFLCGETGAGKSAVASLGQQHFGPGMDALNLPASFESTANSLQVLAFAAKDALMVVDDFAPSGSISNIQQQHRDADRLLRAQGNKSPRNRLRSDSSLRPGKYPRGLICVTGEDVPKGQSLGARMFQSDLPKKGPGAVDWKHLTQCQTAANNGQLAEAMSGYICYIARDYERIKKELRSEIHALRAEVSQDGQHRRTPGIVADLAIGFKYLLKYATDEGAINTDEHRKLWDRVLRALLDAAQEQDNGKGSNDPASRFLTLINSCISSGRAHLANTNGRFPDDWIKWGWRSDRQSLDYGDELRPQGKLIGWINGEDIYIDSQTAYAEAQELGRQQGDSLPVTLSVLKKRLNEKGLLASTEERGKKRYLEIRKDLGGRRRTVLHLHIGSFNLLTPEEVAQVAHQAQTGPENNGLEHENMGYLGSSIDHISSPPDKQKSSPQPDEAGIGLPSRATLFGPEQGVTRGNGAGSGNFDHEGPSDGLLGLLLPDKPYPDTNKKSHDFLVSPPLGLIRQGEGCDCNGEGAAKVGPDYPTCSNCGKTRWCSNCWGCRSCRRA